MPFLPCARSIRWIFPRKLKRLDFVDSRIHSGWLHVKVRFLFPFSEYTFSRVDGVSLRIESGHPTLFSVLESGVHHSSMCEWHFFYQQNQLCVCMHTFLRTCIGLEIWILDIREQFRRLLIKIPDHHWKESPPQLVALPHCRPFISSRWILTHFCICFCSPSFLHSVFGVCCGDPDLVSGHGSPSSTHFPWPNRARCPSRSRDSCFSSLCSGPTSTVSHSFFLFLPKPLHLVGYFSLVLDPEVFSPPRWLLLRCVTDVPPLFEVVFNIFPHWGHIQSHGAHFPALELLRVHVAWTLRRIFFSSQDTLSTTKGSHDKTHVYEIEAHESHIGCIQESGEKESWEPYWWYRVYFYHSSQSCAQTHSYPSNNEHTSAKGVVDKELDK